MTYFSIIEDNAILLHYLHWENVKTNNSDENTATLIRQNHFKRILYSYAFWNICKMCSVDLLEDLPVVGYGLLKEIISHSERVIAHPSSVCLHSLSSLLSDSLCCSHETKYWTSKLSLSTWHKAAQTDSVWQSRETGELRLAADLARWPVIVLTSPSIKLPAPVSSSTLLITQNTVC